MQKGDLIYLDLDTFIVGTDELVDTTSMEVAKAHDALPDHDHEGMDHVMEDHYGPRAVLLGHGSLPQGLDEALQSAAVGAQGTIEVPPEKAFGDRDPKLVEVLSRQEVSRLPEFRREGFEPFMGMPVTVKGRRGYITGVTAGRIRIDFNNRLAGKTLRYVYTIKNKVTGPAEQVTALIELHYGRKEGFTVAYHEEEMAATITLSERCKTDFGWQAVKLALVRDLRAVVDLRRIDLVETYVKSDAPESDDGEDDSKADDSEE